MPYADNLYSADDSDVESFSDELSPTDGYFMSRDQPQDMMVPDPSLQENTANSKAHEARQDAEDNLERHIGQPVASPMIPTAVSSSHHPAPSSYTPNPSDTNTPHSPVSSSGPNASYTESSSLLHPAPPPAYSAATSQAQSSIPVTSSWNYHTISGRELEGGLVSHREPESMGEPVDFNARQPLWTRQARKFHSWTFVRNALLILLVLALGIGLLLAGIKAGKSSYEDIGDGPWAERPSCYCPFATEDLSAGFPTYEFNQGKQLVMMESEYEDGSPQDTGLRRAGKVIFRRLPESKRNSTTGLITFSIWGQTRHGKGVSITMDEEEQAMTIKVPKYSTYGGKDNCISIEVTVWLPEHASFKNVTVFTRQLSIEVLDGVDIYVSDYMSLQSVAGHIIFPITNLSNSDISESFHQEEYLTAGLDNKNSEAFTDDSTPADTPMQRSHFSTSAAPLGAAPERSPKISGSSLTKPARVHGQSLELVTLSGAISGTFLLFHEVVLYTNSGSIDVIVLPQKQEPGQSNIAALVAETTSGSVHIRYPIYGEYAVPDRDYRTQVRSRSGSIQGTYFLGTELLANSNSGSINIDVLSGTSRGSSKFTTNALSGSTQIDLLSARISHDTLESELEAPDAPENINIGAGDPYLLYPPRPEEAGTALLSNSAIRQLDSSHQSQSGSVKIQYPDEWEGQIEAISFSGSLHVGGKDVRTIKDGKKNWAYNEVIARKGPGAEYASLMRVDVKAGSADVWVGAGCGWCK